MMPFRLTTSWWWWWWMLAVGLLAGCGGAEAPGTQTVATGFVIDNVRGYSLVGGRLETFSVMEVDGAGRVVRVGDELVVGAVDRRRIDGADRVLWPGLIDAHGHVSSLGFAMQRVDLTGVGSIDQALERVRTFAAAHPELPWILGRGWNQTLWPEQRFPLAKELDRAVADRPVWLNRIDGHAGWANTAALRAAGISSETGAPPGGAIEFAANGQPAGVLVDAAMALIENVVPAPDTDAMTDALGRAVSHLATLGLTSVHDAGVSAAEVGGYEHLLLEDALPIRVYAMLAGLDVQRQLGPPQTSNPRLVVRSVKLVVDGALGSRGAALIEPYADDPDNTGLLIIEPAPLEAQILEGRRAGYQMNIHAIGDRGNRVVLDAFEAAGAEPSERHRVEHAQIVQLADISRFAELGLIPSMQTIHATSDRLMAIDRLGEARLAGAYAWQTFLTHNSRIANGSDFPVEQPNPFLGFYAAVSRQGLDGEPAQGWLPEQRMTREQAFRSYTLDAAFAAFMEDEIGSLEPGKWADFVLLDRDPFEVEDRAIADTRVLETWVGGRQVWRAPSEPASQ